MLDPRTLSAIEAWFKRKTGQDVVLIAVILIFLPVQSAVREIIREFSAVGNPELVHREQPKMLGPSRG